MFYILSFFVPQVTGILDLLKTNPKKGISGDDTDLLSRKKIFGSNTYPRQKRRSFSGYFRDIIQFQCLSSSLGICAVKHHLFLGFMSCRYSLGKHFKTYRLSS